jgi:hypothetical protein
MPHCFPGFQWYSNPLDANTTKMYREDKSMNVSIVSKQIVKSNVLDQLAKGIPSIISGVLEIPGGRLAILKPEQISLVFTQASIRDVGSDIRIMVFARSNDPRSSSENELAKEILEKSVALIKESGEEYSFDVRLYLVEIGAAKYFSTGL